ncbi:response regulator [Vibrio parahaemolyticus]|nr:response regulator [Vibrio parahaemolyticus]
MNRSRAIMGVLVGGCLFTIFIAVMFYSEYKEINRIYNEQSRFGHDLVEIRDNVTLNSMGSISAPYDLNFEIVDLMRNIGALSASYDGGDSRLVFFKDEARIILGDFYNSALEVSSTLESLVGVIVARESVFSGLGVHDEASKFVISQFSSSEAMDGIVGNREKFASILVDLLQQQKDYLSVLLSHENVEFVEEGERRLLSLASSARDYAVFSIFGSFFLVTCCGAVLAHQRKKELVENNRIFKEAADRMEAATKTKSLFLATMSHELRTPMNGVLGIAQLAHDGTKEVDTKRHIKTILESGEHLVTILNDILDFSKSEDGKMTLESSLFSFDSILDSIDVAIKPLATSKNISLQFVSRIPKDATVEGDPSRVRQILFNLVGNAVKFTNQGGVTVSLDVVSEREGVSIKVLDTGVGIAPDRIDKVFNPFEQADTSTTRKFGGTGLGLSIVKQLVDVMGGDISVFSRVNVGTEFTLKLPLRVFVQNNTNDDGVVQVQSEVPDGVSPKLKILVVEDNKVNALVLKKMCEGDGHSVICVGDGLSAIDLLKESVFDLILMDNHMPLLNGIEAIKIIRKDLGLTTCIFACTADVFKEAHEAFIDAGANYVLTKPLQFSSLKKAMVSKHSLILGADIPGDSNVVSIARLPLNELPMTEEELTSSELINGGFDEEVKTEILQSLIAEVNKNIDIIIESVAEESLEDLFRALHSVKGVALEVGLKNVSRLSATTESIARGGSMPSYDELQMLVNLLLVNSHQAERMLGFEQDSSVSGGLNDQV